MRSWWYRLLENSDLRQARRAAWIAGALIVVLLYTLGGLSLYIRKTMLTSTEVPTPTATATTVNIVAPTALQTFTATAPTQAAIVTPSPTATLYPTLTPDLAN